MKKVGTNRTCIRVASVGYVETMPEATSRSGWRTTPVVCLLENTENAEEVIP